MRLPRDASRCAEFSPAAPLQQSPSQSGVRRGVGFQLAASWNLSAGPCWVSGLPCRRGVGNTRGGAFNMALGNSWVAFTKAFKLPVEQALYYNKPERLRRLFIFI